MNFVPLSQCKTSLDFGPRLKWPENLPPLAWRDHLIAGDSSDHRSALALDSEVSFEVHMLSIYPKLSAVELLNLLHRLESSELSVSYEKLFVAYGYRFKHIYLELASELQVWPVAALAWCLSKDLGFYDLQILRPLFKGSVDLNFLNGVLEKNPSRGEGLRILEMYSDLVLAQAIPGTLGAFGSLSELSDHLFSLRYPKRSEQIKSMVHRSKKISWPKGSQIKWDFSKDSPQMEIRLQIRSSEELKSLQQKWSLVADQVAKEEYNPWA